MKSSHAVSIFAALSMVPAVDAGPAEPELAPVAADMRAVLDDLRAAAPAGSGGSSFIGLDGEWYQAPGWFENGYTELWTLRLYALFDGDDAGVLAVFGEVGLPLIIESFSDAFHNDPFGGDTAPLDVRSAGLWSNQWDTYLTINAVDSQGDRTNIEGIPLGLATGFYTENGGWFVTPDDPQRLARDGRVLLGQFTVACSGGVSGTINLFLDDFTEIQQLNFVWQPTALHVSAPTQATGEDCNDNCIDDILDVGLFYSRDCNGNGEPDECEASSCLRTDLDCSGAVDFGDLVVVLANWGSCGVCDEDLDYDRAVGFQEILAVLGAWGNCP